MSKMTVSGTADQLTANCREFSCSVRICNNFSWAYEGAAKNRMKLVADDFSVFFDVKLQILSRKLRGRNNSRQKKHLANQTTFSM